MAGTPSSPGCQQLGDKEGVALGRGVEIVIALDRTTSELADGLDGERLELDPRRHRRWQSTDQGKRGMPPGKVPVGEDQGQLLLAQPPGQGGQRIEARIVDPVQIFDHHDRRREPRYEIVEQGIEDRAELATGQRLPEPVEALARDIEKRPIGARCREFVAPTHQKSVIRAEAALEGQDERRLADPGFAGDEQNLSLPSRSQLERCGGDGHRFVPLEKLHLRRVTVVSVGRPADLRRSRYQSCAVLTDSLDGGSAEDGSMTSEHNSNPDPSRHEAEVMLDDVIGTLYRDIAEWDVNVSDLTPYGPAVVRRSVRRLIDEHVERLRRQMLQAISTDPQAPTKPPKGTQP